MNEIVKFPINTPVEVTLQSEAGERVEGRYGEQVRYSLTDDRIMYVPLYVEQRFRELAIGAGEPLLLCKQQVKNGDRNRTEWSVKRAPEQQPLWADETVEADPVAAECMPAPPSVEVARNGAETPGEHQTAANGAAKQEEQPSGNSTAPMAQESALQTNNQHQRKNTAEAPGTDIVLPSAARTRRGELTSKDSVFLPAMTMDVAIARRSAIVEFTRRIMVKDQDFGEIPGTHKPTLLKPGAEKLCNFFGLEPEFTPIVEDVDWTGSEHSGEVFCYARYRCRLLREGRVVGAGEGSCNSWEAKYRYRWVAEEQVPEHLDRTHLLKREVRRTLMRVRFCDRTRRNHGSLWQAGRALAEVSRGHSCRNRTLGGETHPAWQRGRLGDRPGLGALPHSESGCGGCGEHHPEDGAEARTGGRHADRDERFGVLHPGRGGCRSLWAEHRHRRASTWYTGGARARTRPQAGGAFAETGGPSGV